MNQKRNSQFGGNLLEYALLIALIMTVSIGAVKYLGKQTKRPSCMVIGAFTSPEFYNTDTAATKWKSDSQNCQLRDEFGGYSTIF